MSWIQSLYQTYEEGMRLDIAEEAKPIPVSHTVQNAHINIIIDGKGNFRRAKVLEKTQIVLPATEKSAGRTSGKAAHALDDKLQYVAGDYKEYGGEKPPYFEGYRQQLADWCESGYVHPSAQAVLDYVSKRQVVKDLVKYKIVWLDDTGKLLKSWPEESDEPPLLFKVLPKVKGIHEQGNALVCWTVEDEFVECPDTWKDSSLQQKWMAYDSSNTSIDGLCYVSGEIQPLTLSHPAKLRHSGDKAKLISSNDINGFTFKGRFTDNKRSIQTHGLQPAGVSIVTTQKAHNALRWLINRPGQALRNSDQVVVAWAISGKEIPSPSAAITGFDLDNFDEVENDEPSTETPPEPVINYSKDLGHNFAKKLSRYMLGYRAELADNDQISIMAIDSATPGRMGITYYRETLPQEYIDQITKWHNDLAWQQLITRETKQKKGKPKVSYHWEPGSPSINRVLKSVYGDILETNKELRKSLIERLLPCIIEGRKIPVDIKDRAVKRACNRNAKRLSEQFSNRQSELTAWEKELAVACSIYKGYLIRNRERSDISMALEENNTSRDYLYGRLLALAERLEEVALHVAKVERPTTANRLMQRFADRPYATWLTIFKQLDPYIQQLKSSRPAFLNNINNELDSVMNMFERDEFVSSKSLTGEFLLGFHCQRLELKNKSKTKSETTEEQKS